MNSRPVATFNVLLIVMIVAIIGGGCGSQRQTRPDPSVTALTGDGIAGTAIATTTPSSSPVRSRPAATATPTATSTLTASPTPFPTATPTRPRPRPPGPTVAPDIALEYARVQPDQFLGDIAARARVPITDIALYSEIEDVNFVQIGQPLIIPHRTTQYSPDLYLLPDAELVYGPVYTDFDLESFVVDQGGYLAQVQIGAMSGFEVVAYIAGRYSVGPRVLLALMEARSGWVTNPEPEGRALDYPLGHTRGASGLWPQLEWAAEALNHGFYGWLDRGETAIRLADGRLVRGHPDLNPGTFAIQRVLAADVTASQLAGEVSEFLAAYERLFGDPAHLDPDPVLPADLVQPSLVWPWQPGEQWYLTSGPHGGWGTGSGWAALDFVPGSAGIGSCLPAPSWVTAAADGVIARSDQGEILVDMDGDGDIRTGWVIQYLHVTNDVVLGTEIKRGQPLGFPSCEGGMAESTHLHLARRYNGLWVAASGPVPLVLGDWTAWGRFEYEGGMRAESGQEIRACNCRIDDMNGIP